MKRDEGGPACPAIFSFICMKSHNVSLGLIYIKSRMAKNKNKGLPTAHKSVTQPTTTSRMC